MAKLSKHSAEDASATPASTDMLDPNRPGLLIGSGASFCWSCSGRMMVPGSITAVFNDPEEFEAAAREVGQPRLCVTASGQFKARLTHIALDAMSLSAIEESLPAIVLLTVSPGTLLVTLPVGRSPAPVWGGAASQPNEIMTHSPGQRLYGWSDGPCRWGAIWVSTRELAHYGAALTGADFAVPAGTRLWRPPWAACRGLRRLHAAAVRAAKSWPDTLTHPEAVRGLQQQVIYGLVECLSERPPVEETPARRRHQDLVLRFMELFAGQQNHIPRMDSIIAALDVSQRNLTAACQEQLGMAPAAYLRLLRMHLVRRALRSEPQTAEVSQVAQRHGFHELGRFAGAYRALFGELPSTTLRRNSQAL